MYPILSKRAYVAVAALILVLIWFPYHQLFSVLPILNYNTKESVPTGPTDGTWDFERDGQNLLMSDAQCDISFPGLFKEINRAVEYRKQKHITVSDIDDIRVSNGYVRGMIYNQQLYIIAQQGTFFSREYATISAIHRAILTSPEGLPNIEFAFHTDDIVDPQPQWAYSRRTNDSELWLMPDFGYWSWPETKVGAYHEMQRNAIYMDKKFKWDTKIPKVVWRGATLDLEIREQLLNITMGKSWADVRTLDWGKHESWVNDKLTMADHCRYKYVVHTEGTSNSGRLKYLQNCRSVVIVHKLDWVQHHHHLMVASGPEQNIVEVERDFSDLEGKINAMKSNEEKAENIADKGVKVFRERYLTPAAETCYWRKLIRGWATVSFVPEPFDINGTWRGIPVESFLLMRKMEWGRG